MQSDNMDFSVSEATSTNGMGNLADELADAFSDSGDDDGYYDGEQGVDLETHEHNATATDEDVSKGDLDREGSPRREPEKTKTANLTLLSPHARHQRHRSEYDGSDYGSESDLESPGMPPGLVAKMAAVESLARRGTESYGGPADDVFKRVTEGLRDLGSQSSVEASASRFVSTAASLLYHSRLIHSTG